MPEKPSITLPRTDPQVNNPVSQLRQDLDLQQELFNVQPAMVQRFLEAQAHQLAEAITQHLPQVRFILPDRVISDPISEGEPKLQQVPAALREQLVGGLRDRLTRTDIRAVLRERLAELQQSNNHAVSTSAVLIRYTTAYHMVHSMLPSGRSVNYRSEEGEEIPSIPISTGLDPESAITATTDAIAEEGNGESGRGELIVPYVPAARRFYLPQWVAFDDQGKLLIKSIQEAEAHIASMQRFLAILHGAVGLAPCMVADEDYQRKRYGMLGQLVNQGRALARYQTKEIIRVIKQRAAAHDLNRGLSISLPYFDDQSLELKTHDFEVIPAGRIMFVPAFMVRASREEEVKVAQDTRLNTSTRKHLLNELKSLESAFIK